MRTALDEHYAQHPEAQPDLGEITIATAELDGNPLTAYPDRVRQAATEIAAVHPHPDPKDVLLWVDSLSARGER